MIKMDQWGVSKTSINTGSTGIDSLSLLPSTPNSCSTSKKSVYPSPLWKRKNWWRGGGDSFYGKQQVWVLELKWSQTAIWTLALQVRAVTTSLAASQWPGRNLPFSQLWSGFNENPWTVLSSETGTQYTLKVAVWILIITIITVSTVLSFLKICLVKTFNITNFIFILKKMCTKVTLFISLF